MTNLLIDELHVPGHLSRLPDVAVAPHLLPAVSRKTGPLPPVERLASRVRLSGSILLVNDRPFFFRMIEHRGEPLAFLKGLGFNSVRLASLPTSDVLQQAAETGMWLVCPPPGAGAPDPIAAIPAEIGPEFDPVLAWDMGHGLARREFDIFKSWAEAVRRADRRLKRPRVDDAPAHVGQQCRAGVVRRLAARAVEPRSSRYLPLGNGRDTASCFNRATARRRGG
ncbi:MAG: hypothetical protein HY000_12065 [Planctomycetes bacterium]|nr:hypothetical protein [Planctomycetota bacterium]